jgi:protein-L-isoaspartate(D-aspartate) O-methyltransferase
MIADSSAATLDRDLSDRPLAPDYDTMRRAMVSSQLRPNAVNDPRVVAAMAIVPREHFVPAEERPLAYRDAALPLGGGRWLNVPTATGRLLTQAYLRPTDRVLLIGAATGYTAAVLAELVAGVTAVESSPALMAMARGALGGTRNVTLVEGALEEGAPGTEGHDVLLVDGAVEELPSALAAQLAPDARVVTGLSDGGVLRLASGRRVGDRFGLQPFADQDCVVLPGFARPRGFRF